MDNQTIDKLSLALRMGETIKMVGRLFFREMQTAGITMEQFLLLLAIDNREETNQQELSLHFHKDKSAILRLTDELERKKMVVRMVDEHDRRKKTLVLTKKGMETLEKVKSMEAEVHHRVLAGVTDDELKVISVVFEKMRDNASK